MDQPHKLSITDDKLELDGFPLKLVKSYSLNRAAYNHQMLLTVTMYVDLNSQQRTDKEPNYTILKESASLYENDI
jgi:hypothetical protein